MWTQLKIELYKVWKRPLFIALLLLPIVVFSYECCFPERLAERTHAFMSFFNISYSQAFYRYLMTKITFFNLILLVCLCFHYFYIEYKHQGYNSLFTLPQNKITIYLAKILLLLLYVIAAGLVIHLLFMFASVALYDKLSMPELPASLLFIMGSILIALFQFLVANFTKNLLFYLITFILLFAVTLVNKIKILSILLPYSYVNLSIHEHTLSNVPVEYILPVYILVIAGAGYVVFKHLANGKSKKS